jgi:outer membrane protein OmpA-like peptidoglycan-associated protein
MNMLPSALLLVFLSGCAATAPKELVDARIAQQRASEGVAAQLNPADLHSAKESMTAAEQSFAEDGDTLRTRDLSYTANVLFQTAESRARTLGTERERDLAIAQMQSNIAASGERATADLGRANEQIANRDRALMSAEQKHAASQNQSAQALEAEKQRRIDAERRAAIAAADLARLGAVKNEPRGMVLTLSGAVLFASNKAELLPSAQVKLNQVADVLIKQDPDSKIVVEGFTDSQGTAPHNQDLSERRAKSVREYLVSRGIAADRVSSQGFGLNRPVADNTSAEGRANNRRVEIVVTPAQPR